MTRTIIHGNADGNGSLTIGHITCGIEFSLPMRPKWSGTTGVVFQVLLTVLTTVYIFLFLILVLPLWHYKYHLQIDDFLSLVRINLF